MVDPIETFKMPPELDQLLSRDANREVLDKILDIDRRLFERDPETEAGRGEGRHLWELFDSIASKFPRPLPYHRGGLPTLCPCDWQALRPHWWA